MTAIKQDFADITAFIYEIEKLKQVERRIKPKGLSRYENSAEHSWHIALLAQSLMPYAENPVDPLRVVTMLLIHDIVEIDTGDKFAYVAEHDDFENEHQAAKRIFGLLPDPMASTYLSMWEEFEAAKSHDAQFAKAIDRLMPVLQNLNNGCQSWLEHGITVEQVLKKNAGVAKASEALWMHVTDLVKQKAQEVGVPLS
ncbi:HD domain-containing protein [Fluctibacter corallii]